MELHYTEIGTGPPIVTVHGGLADYRLWGPLSETLSRNFRVVSYSRRGAYPNSKQTALRPNVAVHSGDLSSLISYVSNEPVHLIAESYGACVALHCAIHHPEKVRSLAIDEPPVLTLLRGNEEDKRDLNHFETNVLGPVLDYFARDRTEDAVRALIDGLEGSTGVYDSLPRSTKEVIAVNSQATYDDLKGGFGGIGVNDLKHLEVPSLLMKSELGIKPLKRVVERLHETIPGARLATIEGTSHGTIVESSAYIKVVSEFVSKN